MNLHPLNNHARRNKSVVTVFVAIRQNTKRLVSSVLRYYINHLCWTSLVALSLSLKVGVSRGKKRHVLNVTLMAPTSYFFS